MTIDLCLISDTKKFTNTQHVNCLFWKIVHKDSFIKYICHSNIGLLSSNSSYAQDIFQRYKERERTRSLKRINDDKETNWRTYTIVWRKQQQSEHREFTRYTEGKSLQKLVKDIVLLGCCKIYRDIRMRPILTSFKVFVFYKYINKGYLSFASHKCSILTHNVWLLFFFSTLADTRTQHLVYINSLYT